MGEVETHFNMDVDGVLISESKGTHRPILAQCVASSRASANRLCGIDDGIIMRHISLCG